MTDANPAFHPLDPGRINLLDADEVAYWCSEFGCNEAELTTAVAKVGTHTAAVRDLFETGSA